MTSQLWFNVGILLFETVILYISIRNILDIKTLQGDISQLFDITARMSKKIAEHHEAIEVLGQNGNEPEESENEAKDAQKELDNKYNEGMDNIFGYSVNTGIRTGDR